MFINNKILVFVKRFGFVMISAVLTLPYGAHAQGFSGVLLRAQDIINSVVYIIIGVAAILFMWGLINFIGSVGDPEKRKAANGRMIFGIIVLAVMLGIWGLVNVLVNTLDLDGYAPPPVEVQEGIGGSISGGGTFGSGQTPLVPCTNNCTACDLYKLVHRVMNYIMFLAVPLAVLSISIGGALILFGAGINEGWITTGKGYIWNALLGLIIILASWLIINTIISQLARPGVLQAPWSEVRC